MQALAVFFVNLIGRYLATDFGLKLFQLQTIPNRILLRECTQWRQIAVTPISLYEIYAQATHYILNAPYGFMLEA